MREGYVRLVSTIALSALIAAWLTTHGPATSGVSASSAPWNPLSVVVPDVSLLTSPGDAGGSGSGSFVSAGAKQRASQVRDGPSYATSGSMPRQMWVWHPGNPKALVALAHRYGVTQLLVWVSPGFTANPTLVVRLTSLRLEAALSNIQVSALCGDPSWASNPQVAGQWATEARNSGLFSRLHLDVEPHARPDWVTRRLTLTRGLLATLRAAAASGLPVDADIPYWYNAVSTSGGEPLDLAVMRLASSVTIMAYRNNAAAALAAAAPELAHAQSAGKLAWLGLNTASTGADPASTSFLGRSRADIQKDFSTLDVWGQRWPSLAGLALHDSDSLAVLR